LDSGDLESKKCGPATPLEFNVSLTPFAKNLAPLVITYYMQNVVVLLKRQPCRSVKNFASVGPHPGGLDWAVF